MALPCFRLRSLPSRMNLATSLRQGADSAAPYQNTWLCHVSVCAPLPIRMNLVTSLRQDIAEDANHLIKLGLAGHERR